MRGKENMPAESEMQAPRTLRARKPVSYDDRVVSDEDVEESESRSIKGTKRKRVRNTKQTPATETSSESDDSSAKDSKTSNDDDEYEKMRKRNIEERMKLVESLGILDMKNEQAPKPKKEKQKKKPPTPRAKSQRVRSRDLQAAGQPPTITVKEEVVAGSSIGLVGTVTKESARKPSGPLPMVSLKLYGTEMKREEDEEDPLDAGASKCADFVSLLRPFLVHKGDESKLNSCSLDTFKKIISGLKLSEEMIAKTNSARITSMAFHPGEEKLLVAAGSTAGDLSLWDVYNPDEENCVEVLGPHTGQINCTSFDQYNPCKILTTSLDGTVRRGDLMKMVFEEMWASDSGPKSHVTWHDQEDQNTLLIARGDGQVVIVDSRANKKPTGWFQCHASSVRTVHKNAKEFKYFVTASGLGQVRIWDWRTMGEKEPNPLWDLVHPKGLSSAFFSCEGNLLLTTCNDDRIRVYHTAYLPGASKPKVVTNIKHYNHTGPYVSVFKAIWHPQREDVFAVGSMDKERKLQIYGIHGLPVYNLMSDNLTTIPAVNAWHPTLPVIAGGNASGRVHLFMGNIALSRYQDNFFAKTQEEEESW